MASVMAYLAEVGLAEAGPAEVDLVVEVSEVEVEGARIAVVSWDYRRRLRRHPCRSNAIDASCESCGNGANCANDVRL
jgi:hypothetical protein